MLQRGRPKEDSETTAYLSERLASYRKYDTSRWDEEGSNLPWNVDSIEKLVMGYMEPVRWYEHSSFYRTEIVKPEELPLYHHTLFKGMRAVVTRQKAVVNLEELSAKSEKFAQDIRDLIAHRCDSGIWDEEGSNLPCNADSIDELSMKSVVNLEELPAKCETFAKDIRDLIARRASNARPAELQKDFWDEYERVYRNQLKGKTEEDKIKLVVTSLYNCCLEAERREKKGLIDNLPFLLWMFEQNLINRDEIASKFLDHTTYKSKQGEWKIGEVKAVVEMAERLCSWNVVLLERVRTLATTLGKYDSTEKRKDKAEEGEVVKGEKREEEKSGEKMEKKNVEKDEKMAEKSIAKGEKTEKMEVIEKNGEKEKDEEEDCTNPLLSTVSRSVALISLLDNEQIDMGHDLDEMMERMGEIDCAEAQLPLLLDWALQHRSAMGCTLAARIIKRWSLPSTLPSLLDFILNARPPPKEKETRRSKGEAAEKMFHRFLRTLTRLIVALSHEELVSYQDLHAAYTTKKEYFDGRSNQGYSLPDLLAGLPIVDRAQQKKMEGRKNGGSKKGELCKRAVALLNRASCCCSAQSWYDPMSAEDEREARAVVEAVKFLSHREAHEVASSVGDAVIAAWSDAGRKRENGEEARLSVPARSALLLVCQLMEATVDSSLLPRFLLQSLPYLLLVAPVTPHLAVYASTVALFLTARCFQSHLTLAAMGVWPLLRKRMAELVRSLCPAHWQTRRIVMLFELSREQPAVVCSMQHCCAPDGTRKVEKEVIKMLQTLLRSEEEWEERRLITVADLVGDVCAQLGTQSIRNWWRRRLIDEITAGSHTRRPAMLRLYVLSVYRGVIDPEEAVERAREGMGMADPSIVSASVALLDALLVGGSNRSEEQLLVEGSIGGEEVGRAIEECARMGVKPLPASLAAQCSTMASRLMKRQYGKRVMRERIEEIARSEHSLGMAETYRQLARKCSGNGWSGLEMEEGGRGLAGVSVFEADAARREMQWLLVKEHSFSPDKPSPTVERLAASAYEAVRGEPSSASLSYLLLHELREGMVEEESPPLFSSAYRAFASSMVSRFTAMMRRPESLPSTSPLLLPLVLFTWTDADKESRVQMRLEMQGFMNGWREKESSSLVLVARLAIALSVGMGKEWIRPFHEMIEEGVIGDDRNGELLEQTLEMIERVESREEKEEKEGDEEEKVQSSALMKPCEWKRDGLRISSCHKIATEDWLNARGRELESWRRLNQAHALSPRGRWCKYWSRKGKLLEELRTVEDGLGGSID